MGDSVLPYFEQFSIVSTISQEGNLCQSDLQFRGTALRMILENLAEENDVEPGACGQPAGVST